MTRLQIGNMVQSGWMHALSVLEAVAAGKQELPRLPAPAQQLPHQPQPGGGQGRRGGQVAAQEDGGEGQQVVGRQAGRKRGRGGS